MPKPAKCVSPFRHRTGWSLDRQNNIDIHSSAIVQTAIVPLATSSGKHNAMVWRPSVSLSVCPVYFLTLTVSRLFFT